MTRRLRIAGSVFFAVLTVLLGVMWVRSYWRIHAIHIPTSQARAIFVVSDQGMATFSKLRPPFSPNKLYWKEWVVDDEPRRSHLSDPWRKRQRPIVLPTYFAVPYRLLFALSGVLSVVPWIPWSSRFRLRTLFIATTLIAVLLAVWFTA